jgi:hypothetical protein
MAAPAIHAMLVQHDFQDAALRLIFGLERLRRKQRARGSN